MALRHQMCFVRLHGDTLQIRVPFLHNVLRKQTFQQVVFRPSQTSFGCPRFRGLIVNFTRVILLPSSLMRCFMTMPSTIPDVYSSASAALKLADCCVRHHAAKFALLRRRTPPLALSHVPVAVCVHIHGLWECDDVDITLRTWDPFTHLMTGFMRISSLSVGCKIFHDICFTLLQKLSSFLAHAQQLSRWCPFHAWRSSAFRILQVQHGSSVSHALWTLTQLSTHELFLRSLWLGTTSRAHLLVQAFFRYVFASFPVM